MEDLNPLLALMPPHVRAWAMAVLALISAVGILALGLKGAVLHFMGDPKPEDSKLKTSVYKFFSLLDVLGINTRTFASMIELARKEGEIRKLQKSVHPPPVQSFDHPVSVPPPSAEHLPAGVFDDQGPQ